EDHHEIEGHSPPSTPTFEDAQPRLLVRKTEDEKKTVTAAIFRGIGTGPRQQVPPHNVRMTEDDDQTGDSGMGTGSDDPWDVRSFPFHRNVRMTENDDETADMRTGVPPFRPIRRIRGGRTDVSSDKGN
ncbi:hypothetical protein GBAR_LOCUS15593, partial [Geodia barretti]